jgi:hypothetical protein
MNHTYMPLQNVLVEEKYAEMVLERVVFLGLQIAIFNLYAAPHATLLTQ